MVLYLCFILLFGMGLHLNGFKRVINKDNARSVFRIHKLMNIVTELKEASTDISLIIIIR